MDSATEVRYGGVVVGRSPQVRDRTDAGAFVVFGEPLPVGTALVLKIDDKDQHARVTEVVESADASAAGMRVRFVKPGEKARARAGAAPPPRAAPAPRAAPHAPAAAPPPVRAPEPAAPVAAAARRPTGVRDRVGARSRSRRRGRDGSAGSAGVPSSGDASAQHAADSHGHHDGEHGRRKRRRK